MTDKDKKRAGHLAQMAIALKVEIDQREQELSELRDALADTQSNFEEVFNEFKALMRGEEDDG